MCDIAGAARFAGPAPAISCSGRCALGPVTRWSSTAVATGALCSLARRRIPAGLPGGLTARWRGALSMRARQIWPDGGNDDDGALGAVQAGTGHGVGPAAESVSTARQGSLASNSRSCCACSPGLACRRSVTWAPLLCPGCAAGSSSFALLAASAARRPPVQPWGGLQDCGPGPVAPRSAPQRVPAASRSSFRAVIGISRGAWLGRVEGLSSPERGPAEDFGPLVRAGNRLRIRNSCPGEASVIPWPMMCETKRPSRC